MATNDSASPIDADKPKALREENRALAREVEALTSELENEALAQREAIKEVIG